MKMRKTHIIATHIMINSNYRLHPAFDLVCHVHIHRTGLKEKNLRDKIHIVILLSIIIPILIMKRTVDC